MAATAYLPTPVPTPPPLGSHAHSSSSAANAAAKVVELRQKKQAAPPYLPDRYDYRPTHPGLVKVEFGPEGEEFGSCLRAERSFRAGETLCPIRNTLPGLKAYSSVQVLPDPPLPPSPSLPSSYSSAPGTATPTSRLSPTARRHIELNSDLLYVNHSCDPNVVFDVNGVEAGPEEEDESGRWEGRWRVRAEKDIAKGEILTFAYFSTEWDMDQPFSCLCGTERCLGTICGAKDIEPAVLDQYFVNNHIKAMKAHQLARQL
ncbi:hypothetical protein JCM8097_007258 [Rhodosporidiobolus ruineniae]